MKFHKLFPAIKAVLASLRNSGRNWDADRLEKLLLKHKKKHMGD